ncbi:MAG: dockerin type I repeat-containing protein [Planctomycetota bacterium]
MRSLLGVSVTLLLGVCGLSVEVAAAPFVRGDANTDLTVDVADAVTMLSTLFVPGTNPLVCADAGDANDDGVFNIADAIYLLSHLFVPASPAPPAPFPGSGDDPTADALECGPPVGILPFETIAQGPFSGLDPQLTIVRDDAEWSVLWSQHDPATPAPTVDFSQEMVVVIVRHFSSGTHFVDIQELIADSAEIQVHHELGSSISCIILFLPTQVHHLVRCPSTAGDPASFETVVDTCP